MNKRGFETTYELQLFIPLYRSRQETILVTVPFILGNKQPCCPILPSYWGNAEYYLLFTLNLLVKLDFEITYKLLLFIPARKPPPSRSLSFLEQTNLVSDFNLILRKSSVLLCNLEFGFMAKLGVEIAKCSFFNRGTDLTRGGRFIASAPFQCAKYTPVRF